jgi:hypothetical protein
MRKIKRFTIASLTLLALLSSTLFGAGEVKDGKVSTYLIGALQEVSAVESALKSAGFEILAEHQIDPSGDLTTIVFTSATLKKLGNNEKRGFASILRVLVNKADGEIAITNPIYFEKAFLQEAYDDLAAKKVLAKLNSTFSALKDSKDGMEFDELSGYHFMMGMPYYEDMDVVAKGAHDALLAKVKAHEGGKNLIFELNLAPNRTLIGYKIDKQTAGFVHKIGTKNAFVLPYTILIEGDKAYALAAKYYLALSYPQLKMSQFMTIATVPGAIEKECKKAFK